MPEPFLHKISKFFKVNYLQFIFIIAFTSVLGSLYYSEVLQIEPCSLCWYQRIFMYPIALITFLAIVKQDLHNLLPFYIGGLALPGFIIGTYQYILQITTAAGNNLLAPCSIGRDCSQIDIIYFNFLTIPLLSALAFAGILLLCFNVYLSEKHTK